MSATDSGTLRDFIAAEHPSLAPALDGVARRSLLKAMAASLALAGLSGCDWRPDDDALPYVNAPENVAPGQAKWYATAVALNGYALPVLGKTVTGRPVKLEGNPDHPAGEGGSDPFLQAALLGLYDPGRSRTPRRLGRPASWDAFDAALDAKVRALDARQGQGFRMLTGTVTSPTMARQIRQLLTRWPRAGWHVFEPINEDLRLEAARLVFGRPLEQRLLLEDAEAIVSLDDDILGPGPRQAMQARAWSKRRLAYQRGEGNSRLMAAEPILSLTGVRADHRLIAPAAQIGPLALAIAAALGAIDGAAPPLPDAARAWVARSVDLLRRHQGRALLTIGPWYPPEVQALGLLINERIGALGRTMRFVEPVAEAPTASFAALVADMHAGRVDTLAAIDVNPIHAAPADLDFAAALQRVQSRLHAGLYHDETAALCHWHLPLAHELESWSDARAIDGTASIIQPLVQPLGAVRSRHGLLAGFTGENGAARDLVRTTWQAVWLTDFAGKWSDALYRGLVPDSAAPFVTPVTINRDFPPPAATPTTGVAVAVRPDPTIWDGRFANIGWLQELPKPLTKVAWTNVVAISPALAKERGFANGDQVELSIGDRAIIGSVWVVPGQEADTVALTLGYGRGAETGLAAGRGYNAAVLQTADAPWHRVGGALEAAGAGPVVAATQMFQAMDGFDFIRTVDRPGEAAKAPHAEPASFYPDHPWDRPSWGMSIDLDLCIGCNACVVACMAENNVPVVGRELVAEGRAMHWIRVDHYTSGEAAAPKSAFQPVPCMHCEQAPCEMGCPVNATVHSSDGLNLQVYNRCIGTRTCSAYCPYKVRRFNWFDFTADDPESIRAMRNPDVTVRQRGVMEKCTYCVQRIREARIAADKTGRAMRDGEVVTACQQACPTQAIVFGDILDPAAAVAKRKADGRDYTLLEEVNTRPRTTYLARIEEGEG